MISWNPNGYSATPIPEPPTPNRKILNSEALKPPIEAQKSLHKVGGLQELQLVIQRNGDARGSSMQPLGGTLGCWV